MNDQEGSGQPLVLVPAERRDSAETRAILKEALKEWLDEQLQSSYKTIGRWTIRFMMLMAFVAFVHMIISVKGDQMRDVLMQSVSPH